MAFGPLQLGLPSEVKKRVDDVIDMLGISGLKNRTPGQLSGGEKKKVAIASVLSLNPQVLLLDEPTNALDLRTRHWFINLVSELRNAGKTIITATRALSGCQNLHKGTGSRRGSHHCSGWDPGRSYC